MESDKLRVRRSIAEKRRIVELTYTPGMSVARVAQAEGVNSHQVFQWRRAYRDGRLVEAGERSTSLLPVVLASVDCEGKSEQQDIVGQEPTASSGAIHIELPGRATISVERGADRLVLQAILESLGK